MIEGPALTFSNGIDTVKIKRFEKNLVGKDYVVGDIHGTYSLLARELERLHFNPHRDRLFSVGDLVDRGPESPAALKWLDYPWFHPCRGNHDNFVIQAQCPDFDVGWWVMVNGGDWWLTIDPIAQKRFSERFKQLPMVIEVETGQGKVGIVHADVPPDLNWTQFIEEIEHGNSAAHEYALWSRNRAAGRYAGPVKGIDRVYCGHTVNKDGKIKVVGNVYFLDTGAAYKLNCSRLTIVPLTYKQDAAKQ